MKSVRLKDDDIDRLSVPHGAFRTLFPWVLQVIALFAAFYIMIGVARAEEAPSQYDVLVYDPPTEEEYRAVEAAIAMCGKKTHSKIADPHKVLALIRLEEVLSIPKELRGIFNAIWCIESSMRSESKDGGLILGDGGTSFGPMQMKKGMVHACIDRHGIYADNPRTAPHDLIWAATCWAARIHAVYPKAKAQCPHRPWQVAEAVISNYSRYSIVKSNGSRVYNCAASSKHYKLLFGS
jgi:hypothetical protein